MRKNTAFAVMLSISSWKAGIYGDQESKGVKFSFSELVLGFTKFCHVYRTITLSLHPYVRRSTTMWLTYDGIIPWPNLHPPWKFPLGLWRFLSNNVPKTTYSDNFTHQKFDIFEGGNFPRNSEGNCSAGKVVRRGNLSEGIVQKPIGQTGCLERRN